jgi:hypothetical protein
MRRLLVLLLLVAGIAAPAHAATGRLTVVIIGQNHTPLVNARWSYKVTVTANGKPVSAFHIHLRFLFGGVPVGEVGVHNVKGSVWRETFGTPGHPPFPPASRGQHLVLQAIVTVTGYPVAKAGWAVTPR